MDADALTFLWTGILLGMQAGFAPGPVSTLLITESLLHGRRSGMRIAFVPILTDLPVVGIVVPLLYFLTFDAAALIGAFSMFGALILCWLGYESLTVSRDKFAKGEAPRTSLAKAVAVNFFNPNLYIYWIGVCGPLCVRALHIGVGTMALFLISFYVSITLVKISIAIAVGSVRRSLNLAVIVWINRLLGLAMFFFAVMFFLQGYRIWSGKKDILSQ